MTTWASGSPREDEGVSSNSAPPRTPGPGLNTEPAPGPEFAHLAWRLSGRIVAGVGQVLLWVLQGVGKLLRPLAVRTGAWLYGKRAAKAPGVHDGRTRIVAP